MTIIAPEYIAAGANRHPSAASWDGEILAFGSGRNIAIWRPLEARSKGVVSLISGHTDTVNAVALLTIPDHVEPIILSGAADKTLRVWSSKGGAYKEMACLKSHQGSVNVVAAVPGSNVFVTGAADASLCVWKLDVHYDGNAAKDGQTNDGLKDIDDSRKVSISVNLLQSIHLKPRFFPLAAAIDRLDDGFLVLAVAGTSATIQIYTRRHEQFILDATLTGHEGWIRSLAFTRESTAPSSDILLASASQDKYIRLWRVHKGTELPAISTAARDPSLGAFGKSLSNKPYYIGQADSRYSITFEALLIGHEDWIYTGRWFPATKLQKAPRLLSASADNSLAIWEREEESGYWTCTTRLGEISVQKGSTSATGSTGGFWVGLWSPDGKSVASLGRTGSWRLWSQHVEGEQWQQRIGLSGHVKEVRDMAWSSDGTYLLSTGADQTTRLWAQRLQDGQATWHEVSRPQIHGYDLNCVDTLEPNQFISGADEKLLRVFDKPKAVANLIGKLQGRQDLSSGDLPDAANIPVLGLSNKAITAADSEQEAIEAAAEVETNEREAIDPHSVVSKSALDLDHPPFEDHLARHTLWPEHEKLYGHGYEISAVAASHDGNLVATACRASSIDHAVVRLYETKDWREIKPSLQAHSLTVTSLAFSPDDTYLLTVGRDRQWTIFAREQEGSDIYTLLQAQPKGHSRMILDCSWAPISACTSPVFATAGRDKSVKIWSTNDAVPSSESSATKDAEIGTKTSFDCKATIQMPAAATAVAFAPGPSSGGLLACGSEEGTIVIATLDTSSWTIVQSATIAGQDAPSGSISALRWRPRLVGGNENKDVDAVKVVGSGSQVLAAASEDCSVRLFSVATGDA